MDFIPLKNVDQYFGWLITKLAELIKYQQKKST